MSNEPVLPLVPQSWYRVCHSRDLDRGCVKSWDLSGHPLVVYRGASGRVVAMDARCAHMGAHLQHGLVTGDEIQCALHHWRCGADGVCRPADGPGRLKQSVYPALERYGSVFVFAGAAPRFDLPAIGGDIGGDIGDDGLCVVSGRPRFVRTGWASIATNAFDIGHMDAVHNRAMREEPQLRFAGGDCLEMQYVSRVTGSRLPDRVVRWLSRDSIRATIQCWGGTVITVRSETGAIDSRLLLCLAPRTDGVEVTPFFASRRSRLRGVDEVAVRVSRWLFTSFLERDLVPLDGMNLRIDGALTAPRAARLGHTLADDAAAGDPWPTRRFARR